MTITSAAPAVPLLLMFAVLPVWVAAGLIDYLCHRASRIEWTSGTPESILHLLQFSLVGLPTILALIVEINSAFLLLALAAILLHHLVAYIDVRYANRTRSVSPFEQMVHSFLELLPLTAFLLLATLHWSEAAALFGYEAPPGAFVFRLKDQPLPLWYVITAIAGAAIFNALPYLEELARCLGARSAAASRSGS